MKYSGFRSEFWSGLTLFFVEIKNIFIDQEGFDNAIEMIRDDYKLFPSDYEVFLESEIK